MKSLALANLVYRDGALVTLDANGRKRAGERVGYICRKSGYVRFRHATGNLYVHRLIWELFNGAIPDGMQIDHINGDRADNRIENLRLVTQQSNLRNARMRDSNRTGITGVTRLPSGRFRARIGDKGRTIYLGNFDSELSARNARKAAEERLGYHANHGRKNHAA